jgi:uncharacterized membrane protein
MHTVQVIAGGLIVLALFVGIAVLLKKSPATGARLFILPWLVAALVNLYVGTTHGHTVLGELPFLAIVFGVPAAVAWWVSRAFGTRGGTG